MQEQSKTSNTDPAHQKHIRYDLLDGGKLDYYPGFLSSEEADRLWSICKYHPGQQTQVPWSQDEVCLTNLLLLLLLFLL